MRLCVQILHTAQIRLNRNKTDKIKNKTNNSHVAKMRKGGGGIIRPSRAAESKRQQIGRQNEYFKLKKNILCTQQILNYTGEYMEIQ